MPAERARRAYSADAAGARAGRGARARRESAVAGRSRRRRRSCADLIAALCPSGARDPAVICLGIAGADRPRDVTIVDAQSDRGIGRGARVRRGERRAGRARGRTSRRRRRRRHRRDGFHRLRPRRTRHARPAPAVGAMCWATRAVATGSAGTRCVPSCARPMAAGPRPRSTALVLAHYGADGAQDLIRQIAGRRRQSQRHRGTGLAWWLGRGRRRPGRASAGEERPRRNWRRAAAGGHRASGAPRHRRSCWPAARCSASIAAARGRDGPRAARS